MNYIELTHKEVLSILPDRKPDSHKGNYGRVLLLCGSRGYTGAAALAAMGALRCGAGLVYLGVPECIYAIEAIKLNEAIVFPVSDRDGAMSAEAIDDIIKLLPKMDAVLIGPGLGCSVGTEDVTRYVLEHFSGPVVLDADGINVIAAHKNVLRDRTSPTILTPHPGEFARLGGVIGEDRASAAIAMARDLGATVALKGHRTVITDGVHCYINSTGNPGLAVGGSGDVLAGMITGLLGVGLSVTDAVSCGVWLHGAAADLCAQQMGQYAMLPTDVLQVLPRLLK